MPDLIERAAAKLNGRRVPQGAPIEAATPIVAGPPLTPPSDDEIAVVSTVAETRAAEDNARADAGPYRAKRQIDLDATALSRAGIMTPRSDSSRIVEEFRVIRRPLLTKAFAGPNPQHEKANVILVTSARPGEGKSFVAYNLAMSIASERTRKVILIDADLRNPMMPQLMRLPAGPGLIELLVTPDMDPSEALLSTDFSNLSLLPAGEHVDQSTDLLASPRMGRLVRQLASARDDQIIIIDAAPVLASSEPAVLAHNAGQVVLVVEAERTGRGAVEEALGHLGACRDISLVLNKARGWLNGDQFGAYYGDKPAEKPAEKSA
jgi:receptor protein-tyrosine kinase